LRQASGGILALRRLPNQNPGRKEIMAGETESGWIVIHVIDYKRLL
jgi:hypothetical protein